MDRLDFTDALKPHYNDVVRYCRSLAARDPRQEAGDILQEGLLKAFENYERLNDPAKFKVWLFQIITRTYLSELRRKIRKWFVPFDRADVFGSLYNASLHDDQQYLMKALAQLPVKHRSALLLFELCGFSIQEIAIIQGDRSLSAVKSRLSRARATLKCILQDEKNMSFCWNDEDSNQGLHHELLRATERAINAFHRQRIAGAFRSPKGDRL